MSWAEFFEKLITGELLNFQQAKCTIVIIMLALMPPAPFSTPADPNMWWLKYSLMLAIFSAKSPALCRCNKPLPATNYWLVPKGYPTFEQNYCVCTLKPEDSQAQQQPQAISKSFSAQESATINNVSINPERAETLAGLIKDDTVICKVSESCAQVQIWDTFLDPTDPFTADLFFHLLMIIKSFGCAQVQIWDTFLDPTDPFTADLFFHLLMIIKSFGAC